MVLLVAGLATALVILALKVDDLPSVLERARDVIEPGGNVSAANVDIAGLLIILVVALTAEPLMAFVRLLRWLLAELLGTSTDDQPAAIAEGRPPARFIVTATFLMAACSIPLVHYFPAA